MFNTNAVDEVILAGLEEKVYPGAAVAIGNRDGEIYRNFYGNRQLVPETKPIFEDTRFDIASLTKLVSSVVALKLIESGKLSLTDTLDKFFEVPEDKVDINIQHLMTHTSGLPSHLMLQDLIRNPEDAVHCILNEKEAGKPGVKVDYSCMGYILLGKICEKVSDETLDALVSKFITAPMDLKSMTYNPKQEGTFAVTEFDQLNNEWLEGVVHDENARFLGGVSANAGIFANISDMSKLALMFANKGRFNDKEIVGFDIFELAIKNLTPFSDDGRGLGFEIKSKERVSCSDYFSIGSYGHTGFTGTSLWVDSETSLYVVLLSNRVHPTRDNVLHIPFRRRLHDLCANLYAQM